MEYRLCWNASSNISFSGSTDWEEVEDPDISAGEFENTLTDGGCACEGLSMVLEASGFDWWVETR
jgi:hypothetical protein